MIIYIASYPRSGNSWIQRLIYDQFNRLSSSVYPIANYPPVHLQQQWNIKPQPYPPLNWYGLQKSGLIWHQNIAVCHNYNQPQNLHRFILPGCLDFLSETRRRKLAKESDIFVIKTHELPYQQYFPGEKIIQPIRHPGAVCWSYYNLIAATKTPTESATKLIDVIQGRVLFGSWSGYHQQWLAVANDLGDNYLPIYYEWLAEHQLDCCQGLEKFMGIPYLDKPLVEFSQLQKMNPISKREGKAVGWEKNYTDQQLNLLYICHGETMKQFKYSEDI